MLRVRMPPMQMPGTILQTGAMAPAPARSDGFAEKLARWSVYAFFGLLPFFFIPVPWVSIPEAKVLLATIVVIFGFVAWIVSSIQNARLLLPKNVLLVAAAAIPIIYVLSALASGASSESFVGDATAKDTVISVALWYIALLLSASTLGEETKRSLFALRLLIIGSAVVIIVQLIHLFVPSFTFGGALPVPASSLIGSWHDLGIFIGLLAFLSFALNHAKVFAGAWRYAAVLLAIVGSLFLVIINYGDVWLGVLGLVLLWALFLYRSRAPEWNFFSDRPFLLCIAAAVIALGFYFGGSFVQSYLPSALQVAQFEVRPSWQGTLVIGREVFSEPRQVFFGSGPNTFTREWSLYKPLSVNTTEFWNVDFYYGVGFIPTSLVTTGILGLIAWALVCIALLYLLWQSVRDASRATLVRRAILAGALYLTAFHILYVPGPAISLLTFLMLGLLIAERVAAFGERWVLPLEWTSWRGLAIGIPVIVLAAVITFGAAQSMRAFASDLLVNRAVVEYNISQDLAVATRNVLLALAVHSNNDRAHRASVELGMLQLSELIARNDADAAAELQATLTQTIEHGLRAVSIEDRNYLNWLTLARLYGELAGVGIEGAAENARRAYAEARKNNPTNPLSYIGEAQLDIVLGNDTDAREKLQGAVNVKPNLASAHFLLSQLEARAGDLTKAAEHASVVVQLADQDPLGWYNLGTILYAGENLPASALALERAVGLENNYANALYLLGITYYRLERNEDALRVLRAVEALNPANEELAETIRRIENGLPLGAE